MDFDHGGTVFSAALEVGCRPEEILDFSASINPLGISPAVRKACHDAIEISTHYPDPDSSLLVKGIAQKHGIPADMVVPANGSTSLIQTLPSAITGDSAIIVSPAFSEYEKALFKKGWKAGHHLLSHDNGFMLDTDKLCNRIREEKPALLFFCNPANPAGALYGIEEIKLLLDCCRKGGTVMLLDEAFMDFCGEENSFIRHIYEWDNCIILRSMTKFHAIAGMRLGFAVAPGGIAAKLREAVAPWEVNTIAQYAGIAALADREYAEDTIRLINEEREFLTENIKNIDSIEQVFPSAANYLLIKLGPPIGAPRLRERLFRNHRILIRDCSNFTGLDSSYIRVAVRGREENVRLIDAVLTETDSLQPKQD